MTAEQYGNQQAIYAPMEKQFQSIFAAGPNQAGYSQPELQALDSQALEGTAENYADAAKATNESMASEGGGTNPLPSGAQAQLKAETANSAAQEESKEETGITESDYQQGYNEWQAAGEGLDTIAAGDNPLGYEQAETGEAGAANTEAKTDALKEDLKKEKPAEEPKPEAKPSPTDALKEKLKAETGKPVEKGADRNRPLF